MFFFFLVSTIFSPKEDEFVGSVLFFVIITFGAFFDRKNKRQNILKLPKLIYYECRLIFL